jgi:hypothetical protein
MLLYCVCHFDHCWFMTPPPGGGHSPKTTELQDTKHSEVCYVVWLLHKLKLEHILWDPYVSCHILSFRSMSRCAIYIRFEFHVGFTLGPTYPTVKYSDSL